jgi:hypothetical protein
MSLLPHFYVIFGKEETRTRSTGGGVMQAADIEKYLSQLGEELQAQGVEAPLHILMIGGAFMLLLAHSREQVQALLDRYIPPLTQKINADGIATSFKYLFEK